MRRCLFKKLKLHISSINFDYIENDENSKDYRENSGEYSALCWLKAYVEGRAAAEPFGVVRSFLLRAEWLERYNIDYISTLLPYCESC